MPRPIRIALAQLESSPHLERNVQNLKDAVSRAKAEKANLVILPEFFVQGTLADSPEKVFDGTARQDFAALAKEQDIDIVVGTLVESHESQTQDANAREKKPFNTCVYAKVSWPDWRLMTSPAAHTILTDMARLLDSTARGIYANRTDQDVWFRVLIGSGTQGIQKRTIYIQVRMTILSSTRNSPAAAC